MACQHFPDDQTLRLQTGAGEDDIIHLPSGLDCVDCERQEEEEEGSSTVEVTEIWLESLRRHPQTGVQREVHRTKPHCQFGIADKSK